MIRRLLVLALSVSVAALAGCGSSSSTAPSASGEPKMMESGKQKQHKFEAPPPIEPARK